MSLRRSAAIAMLLVVGALGGVSCTTSESGKPNNGGAKGSVFQRPCEAYCQHLRTLGCKEGAPLKSGTSCETFCIDTQEAGHDLRIGCVLETPSCGEAQSCNK